MASASQSMALFGSKKKADAAAPAPGAPGEVATAPAPTAVVREKKARASKGAIKNGSIVGLNIGNANIKAVEVVAKNGELSVSRVASVPTPPDAFQNGNVLSVSALASAVKALWKIGGFKGKAVISSVAGTGALVVRVIEVPLMTDAQLADAMRADAQLYIPFPPTEVQMDFKALRELPSDPDSGTMDVLLAAAQSEIIDLHIKTLQSAKLDPRAVDVEPIAVGRTLSLHKRGDFNGLVVDYNEITAVANIGAQGTEISLLRGDVLVFTRTVSTGGNSISQGIADALGVPLAEGERIKIEQGDALPPEGYQSSHAGDDFGFGDQGGGFGGDFDDFGIGDTPPPPPGSGGGTNRTTVLDAPAGGSPSADPFDLDFFNQGPKSEPGAGHSQKEGQPNPGGGFSFDDFSMLPSNEPPATPATQPVAPPPSSAGGAFNFDFDMSSSDLPSTAPAPVPPTPPDAPPASSSTFGFGDDLHGEFLPSLDTTPTSPAATPQASTPAPLASAFDFSDFDLPATAATEAPATATPVAVTPAVSVPVAFTPVAEAAPVSVPVQVAEVHMTPPAPVQSGGFSFDDVIEPEPAPLVTTTPEVAAPVEAGASGFNFGEVGDAGLSLEKPAAVVEPVSLEKTAPTSSGFDVDDIFATSPSDTAAFTSPETAVPASEAAGVSFDDLQLDGGQSDGLNLGGVGVDDGFDFGTGTDDFGGFGAGLSAGEDAGGAAIYDALANSLEEMGAEISRSLSFYLERVPDAALSRIYLTGGGALLKNLDVYLTGRLGAPTSILNPLQLLPVAAQSEIVNGPLYTVALGLALRDFVD